MNANKQVIKNYRHAFNWWIEDKTDKDGNKGVLWSRCSDGESEWSCTPVDCFMKAMKYVANDEYAEIRMAICDCKTIQFGCVRIRDEIVDWQDMLLTPDESGHFFRYAPKYYRIKPQASHPIVTNENNKLVITIPNGTKVKINYQQVEK